MHRMNLLHNIKMKENQNDDHDLYENPMNRKSNYASKTIILILIAVIAGLGFIAAVILISIEFNEMHRLSREASVFAFRASNSMNSTILSTIQRTTHTTSTPFSSSTILATTTPLTTTTTITPSTTIIPTTTTVLTTTIQSISMNTTMPTALEDLSVSIG